MLGVYPKIIQSCPSFGSGYSPDERACRECEVVNDCQSKTKKIQNKKIKRKERKMETAKATPKTKTKKEVKVQETPKTEMEVMEKKVKETKPKPERKPVSEWGHRLDSQSGQIDLLVAEGIYTKAQMAEKLSLTEDRIKGHLKHLEKDKGLKLIVGADGTIKV